MAHDTQARATEAEQLAQEEFPDIENLRTRNQELFQLLRAKEKRRDTLRDQAVAELATNTATRTRLEDTRYLFRLPCGGDGPGPHQGHVQIRPVRYAAGTDRNGSRTPGEPTAPQCAGAHHRGSPIPE